MSDAAAAPAPPRLVAVGLLRHGDDRPARYLVTRRARGTHLAGHWELPGGKVEAGESPEQALRRELLEELGVAAEVVRPLTFSHHTYPDRTVLILFYLARTLPGSRPRPLVASELALLTLEEVTELDLPPANRPLLDLLTAPGRTPLDPTEC